MKKTTKGLLSALLLTAMCGTVGCKPAASSSAGTPSTGTTSSSVVSSNKTESSSSVEAKVEDVNLVESIVDGGDGAYVITNNNGKAHVSYDKEENEGWASAKVDLTNVKDLAKMRTLKLSVSGSGILMIKVQGESNADSVEIKLLLPENAYEFQWNMIPNADLLTRATAIYFFAKPNVAPATGSFVVEDLTFTANKAKGFIINNNYTNLDPNANYYDGTTETFSFNKGWVDNDKVVYTFTENDDKSVKVDYKKSGTYQFAYSEIAGDFQKFPYITFNVTGEANDKLLLKVEDNGLKKEQEFTFDGTANQMLTFDLSSFSAEERKSFTRVMMFAAPGVAERKGSYTIHDAYFTMNYEGEKPVVHETNVYDGKAQEFGVNAYWHDAKDGVYTVDQASPFAKATVTYTNKTDGYNALRTQISGKIGNFKSLDFGVLVPEGKKITVKVANDYEVEVVGTGKYDDSYSIDISTMSVTDRNNLSEILIFAEPTLTGVSGTFEIHWMSFRDFKAQENEYNGTDKFFNINQNMQSPAHFTAADANGATKITWAETLTGEEWSTVKSPVKGDFTNLKALSYNVTVPAGRKVLLKLDGTGATNPEVEHWLDNSAGAEAKAFNGIYDFSHLTLDQIKAMTNVLIFPLGGEQANGAAGEVVVSELRLTRSFAKLNEGALDFGSEFFYGAEKYSYAVNEGAMTVNYTETKGEWDNIYTRIINDGYTTVTIEVTGTADKQVLFKFENEANGGNNIEQWHTCDGTKQTVTVDITTVKEAKSFMFLMFAEGGKTGVSGSYTVHSVTFSK